MLLDCYNRGCNSKYREEDNHDQACSHHPGLPYFHDAYKIWSCCQKKSIDFTQFLDIPGCTKSPHSNVKPEPPAKKEEVKDEDIALVNEINNQPVEIIERPPVNTPMAKLSSTISSTLKPHLENLLKKQNNKEEEKDEELSVGTMCKNSGCRSSYNSPKSNEEICVHHTGVPIFHEGMKYWTCCKRKTTDFDAFLEQEGCTQGTHLWVKPKVNESDVDRSKTCRFDWFQTGNDVVINVYSKMPIPTLSLVEANPVKINILVVFGEDKKEFYKEIVLNGIVDLEQSKISYLPSKTEITLKKHQLVQWPDLELN